MNSPAIARVIPSSAERYISQPPVALSRHPTVIGGRLELHHVDLRTFAFSGDEPEVNSSQRGGGKDTWIIG